MDLHEGNMDAARIRKSDRYVNLLKGHEDLGWNAERFTIED